MIRTGDANVNVNDLMLSELPALSLFPSEEPVKAAIEVRQVPCTPALPALLGDQLLLHFTERSPPPPGKVWQRRGGERQAFQVPPF